MLAAYFQPVRDLERLAGNPGSHQLIAGMDIFTDKFPELIPGQLVLFSVDSGYSHDWVRKYLYRLASNFRGLAIADLGYVKPTTHPTHSIRQVISELLILGVFPIIIGGTGPAQIMDFVAGTDAAKPIHELSIIDEQVRFEGPENYLGRLMEAGGSARIHFNVVGCQAHFVPDIYHKVFPDHKLELIGLGKSRQDLSEIEPLMRQSDLLQIHLSALRQTEAPAVKVGSPSGFTTEELCQLSRYAGLSEQLKALGIFDYFPPLDNSEQTAQVIAQLIWYFIDGYYNKTGKIPEDRQQMTKYVVFSKVLGDSIVFWKSNLSGRWWMQLLASSEPELIPCTIKDYSMACQGEIPERLLKILQR